MTLNDYADWSIPDLFDELISYCAGNIGDDTTEAIKAAITSKARSEGKAEGAAEKEAEWRRGYNQGWDERKAFDLPGGALPTSGLTPTKEVAG